MLLLMGETVCLSLPFNKGSMIQEVSVEMGCFAQWHMCTQMHTQVSAFSKLSFTGP